MNQTYMCCVTAVTALIAASTVWKLWTDRDRLFREDLTDEDRAFAWRIVAFLILPLITFMDMRTTCIATELAGGFIKGAQFGMLWYQAIPVGVSFDMYIPVLFSGAAATTLFALLLLPALSFRPHPFLANVIGYTIAITLGINFIVDPILSVAGLGSLRWQLAFAEGNPELLLPLVAIHVLSAVALVVALKNSSVRVWFSSLTRPVVSEELREAMSNLQAYPESPKLALRVGLLYDKAGLRRQAKRLLKQLQGALGHPLYASFLESMILYRRQDFVAAKKSFIYTSDFPGVDGELKANLLAAAACSAFAANDIIGALNLCERALEFDDACLIGRMVKVDVFLRQGKKEQAGEEILLAMHLGLTLELSSKVPLDVEQTYDYVVSIDDQKAARHFITRV